MAVRAYRRHSDGARCRWPIPPLPSTAKMAGFIFPILFNPTNWNNTTALGFAAKVQAIGGNRITLDMPLLVDDWQAGNLRQASPAFPDSALAAQAVAIKNTGRLLDLKVHPATPYGNQIWIMPCTWSTDMTTPGAAWAGHTTNGSTHVTCQYWNLTSADIGRRIVTPTLGHRTEIPNSGYTDLYAASATPNYTTIVAVDADGHGCTISTPAAATSSNSVIAILDGPNVAPYFQALTAIIDNWMSVVTTAVTNAGILAAPVDSININTELDHFSRYYPTQWSALCDHIHQTYPGVKIWTNLGAGLTDLASIPWANKLDYLGISCYPSVGSAAGGDTQASIDAKWTNACANLPNWSAAFSNQKVIFGEVGARSIVGAGNNPASSAAGTTQSPATDQSMFVQGMFDTVWQQAWFGGFHWWVWDGPPGSNNAPGYSPNGKEPTQTTFKNQLALNV